MDQGRSLRDQFRRLLVVQGVLDRAIRPCGTALSLPHAYALLELYAGGDAMTVTELASKLHIDRTSVSRLCQKMEALGQLERAVHPDDARAKALRLTKQGTKLAAQVDASSTDHFGQIVAALGDDVDALLAELSRLEEALCAVSKSKQQGEKK